MANFKRSVTFILSHDDLADMLTGEMCNFSPFNNLRVAYISEKGGQYHINLEPKPKTVQKQS